MPGADLPFCQKCAGAQMMLLKRVVHDDGSTTDYFRCRSCSELEVRSAPHAAAAGKQDR